MYYVYNFIINFREHNIVLHKNDKPHDEHKTIKKTLTFSTRKN